MTHAHFSTCLLLAISLLVLPVSVLAKTVNYANEPTVPTRTDMTHMTITERLNLLTQSFDNFFNDPRIDEEPAGSRVRLRSSITTTEYAGVSVKGRVKANIELPNLKSRYHLILSNDDDNLSETEDANPQATARLSAEEQSTSLGLQYTKRPKQNLIYSTRFSLRLDDGINPGLKSRIRYTVPVSKRAKFNLTQAVFWEKSEGFGQENRLDLDYILSGNILFRTSGIGLFSESSSGYEWAARQQLQASVGRRKAITVGASLRGETRPHNYVTKYNIFTEYRQSFIKKWLFLELLPEISWPREHGFKSVAAFTLTLEVRFGDK